MRIKTIVQVLALCLFASCASVVPPAGGPVDPVPPKVLKQFPAQGSTNFTGREISIEFDEFLAPITDPSSVIISPLSVTPEISVRRKKIIVRFKDALKENTTYSINFGDNIKDNHEGNPLSNFTVVFSTGPSVDTGYISGSIVDARDHSPQKDMLVMLFSDLSDSAPLKLKPSYISKTDLNGLYSFRNIAEGKYRIYGLKDDNKNFNADHDELFAFVKEVIQVKGDTSKQKKLFAAPFRKHEDILITKKRKENELTYVFGFNQDISDSIIRIVPALQTGNQGTELRITQLAGDTIRFYYMPPVLTDSVSLNVYAGNRLLETIVFAKPSISLNPYNLSLSNTPNTPFDTLKITATAPIKQIIKERISIQGKDSNKLRFDALVNPSNPFELFILFNKEEANSYTLNIQDSSIVSFYNSYNRRYKNSFTVSQEKRYGSLNIELENKEYKSLIIWILDKEGKIIRTYYTKNDLKIQETWFTPGEYMLKAIWDKNGNNRFDLTDYENSMQPEPVFIYPNNIVIKSNWEVSGLRISPVFE